MLCVFMGVLTFKGPCRSSSIYIRKAVYFYIVVTFSNNLSEMAIQLAICMGPIWDLYEFPYVTYIGTTNGPNMAPIWAASCKYNMIE